MIVFIAFEKLCLISLARTEFALSYASIEIPSKMIESNFPFFSLISVFHSGIHRFATIHRLLRCT